jgi:hypothetical protein
VDTFAEQQQRKETLLAAFAGGEILSHPKGLVAGISFEVRLGLHSMARDVARRRSELAFSMRHLAEKLEQESWEAEVGGSFNVLGVVQGHGAEVDRKAGELAVLTDAFHQMAGLILGEHGIVDLTRPAEAVPLGTQLEHVRVQALIMADLKLHPQSTAAEVAARNRISGEKVREVLERGRKDLFARVDPAPGERAFRWSLKEKEGQARTQ